MHSHRVRGLPLKLRAQCPFQSLHDRGSHLYASLVQWGASSIVLSIVSLLLANCFDQSMTGRSSRAVVSRFRILLPRSSHDSLS